MPKGLKILGYGGLIPFFFGAILTLIPANLLFENSLIYNFISQFLQATGQEIKTGSDQLIITKPVLVDWGRRIVLFYGAIILSFLGGINWGLFLTKNKHMSVAVLISGVMPSLLGFFALLFFTIPSISLFATVPFVIMGYIFIWFDHKFLAKILALPEGFMQLRTRLTMGAGLSLLIVLL